MRLIDADRFLSQIEDQYREDDITREKYVDLNRRIAQQPTIEERKKGKWLEKHHAYSDEKSGIEEWQSCCCSVCGRYDTRPYMYYFEEPHFCSWCGADMRGEEE